jgi:hypothetical protein
MEVSLPEPGFLRIMVYRFQESGGSIDGMVILMPDFYANSAQVLAIVILALVWDSGYFSKLRTRTFTKTGFWSWNRAKIRAYSVAVAVVVISDLGLCMVVLAGLFTNSTALRVIVGAGVALVLGTLLFRMVTHIMGWDSPPDSDLSQRP